VKEAIFKTVWELKKEGYTESTIDGYNRKLRFLASIADSKSPEIVKEVIAVKTCSTAFNEALVNAYHHYVRVNGLVWRARWFERD
jgi:hypothetical protein